MSTIKDDVVELNNDTKKAITAVFMQLIRVILDITQDELKDEAFRVALKKHFIDIANEWQKLNDELDASNDKLSSHEVDDEVQICTKFVESKPKDKSFRLSNKSNEDIRLEALINKQIRVMEAYSHVSSLAIPLVLVIDTYTIMKNKKISFDQINEIINAINSMDASSDVWECFNLFDAYKMQGLGILEIKNSFSIKTFIYFVSLSHSVESNSEIDLLFTTIALRFRSFALSSIKRELVDLMTNILECSNDGQSIPVHAIQANKLINSLIKYEQSYIVDLTFDLFAKKSLLFLKQNKDLVVIWWRTATRVKKEAGQRNADRQYTIFKTYLENALGSEVFNKVLESFNVK